MSAPSQPPPTTELSRVRGFLFIAMALVWFSEMNFLGFQTLAEIWTRLWQVSPPGDPRLTQTLYETWSIGAPAKGALLVMAIYGLRSRQPATRAALFASMALVPPFNLAFPFRYQGWLTGPVTVATTLSLILWSSFFLFRERASAAEMAQADRSGDSPASGWETFQYLWFVATAALLTLFALLLLMRPMSVVPLALPCRAELLNTNSEQLSGLIQGAMGAGTHFLAVSTAVWLAAVNVRRHPDLARAVAVAITASTALFVVFPLRQIVQDSGLACARSSILMIPLLLWVAWLLYLVIESRHRPLAADVSIGGLRP